MVCSIFVPSVLMQTQDPSPDHLSKTLCALLFITQTARSTCARGLQPKVASHEHTTKGCKPQAYHRRLQATSTPPKVASHKHTTEDCKPRARHQRLQATSTPPQAHHRRLMKATSTPPNSIYLEHPHAKAPSLQKHVHPETLAVLFV